MKKTLKITVGLISLGLLGTLIYKLTSVPGGMILSGLYLGGMMIILILVGGLLVAFLTKSILSKLPFWTAYFTWTAIAFAVFHYQIYSPTLKIVVPENYTGEVNLIKSNVSDNILTLDANGIGYLNEWTFNKLYSKPIVVDETGKDLSAQCVGFNPSTFFGLKSMMVTKNQKEIKSLSFEIVAKNKIGQKQYFRTNLLEVVDKEKIE